MFAFLGSLFGSKKAGEAIIDGVTESIDKMWYTEEEKAGDAAQAKRDGMAKYMAWLESTSGSRLARRVIALVVTMPWALANFVSMVLDATAPFITGTDTISKLVDGKIVQVVVLSSDKWGEAAQRLSDNAWQNNTLVGVVLLFYFGGPAAVDASKGMIEKWTNRAKGS